MRLVSIIIIEDCWKSITNWVLPFAVINIFTNTNQFFYVLRSSFSSHWCSSYLFTRQLPTQRSIQRVHETGLWTTRKEEDTTASMCLHTNTNCISRFTWGNTCRVWNARKINKKKKYKDNEKYPDLWSVASQNSVREDPCIFFASLIVLS